MKFRVTALGYVDGARATTRDVTLTVDVTSTVADVASGLVRAGAGHPDLLQYAVHRLAPLTLRVERPGSGPLILDAGDPIQAAGLMSGQRVEPVLEASPGSGQRARTPAAQLTPLDGPQKGIPFVIPAGETTIGRDRSNRIELQEQSVSRKHAIARRTPDGLEIEDLGSANGTFLLDPEGRRIKHEGGTLILRQGAVLEIGGLPARIDIGPPTNADVPRASSVPRIQAPHVDPVFAPDPVELPAPPDQQKPGRFPLIAMIAPLLMGAVLYATTRSVLSIIFVGLSPLIMIGSWLDQRLSRRKSLKEGREEFLESLTRVKAELTENLEIEAAARDRETPTATVLAAQDTQSAPRLWVHRPEHRAFLELRLGSATLPARKQATLPARGKILAADWERMTEVHEEFRSIPGAPLLERLDRCGSLGVAGHPFWASQVTRSLLVQLLSSHSPANLVLAGFTDATQAETEWGWLKWLPHVDSAFSPVAAPHLVADVRSAGMLLTALESVIASRAERGSAKSIRSRIEGTAQDAKERLAPADGAVDTPAIVVLVLSTANADLTRLIGIAEDGADVGVHVLWQAAQLADVPAACRTTVEVAESSWRAHFVRQGEVIELTAIEALDEPPTETFARSLAPVTDAGARVLDESDLPKSVPLTQLLRSDVLGSGDAIVREWAATGSLMSTWQDGAERESGPLAAIVGQGSVDPMEIDLRTHGPHALVGGTTGSGKSEFLQSWIMSLAAKYSPDRLTFLLVDYKGGSAFSVCAELPHTVGLVTDLNMHLVRRALVSLRAELHYREELLAAKSAKDLITLERRSDPDAPPTLVVVIDEFAALVNEIPEFVDGMIDIAQRGRSLGIHLIMGTQRPAGVIKDNLRANTNLRVSLRMADASDSSDVIGVPDAAFFAAETPGRAVVKVGAGQLAHFQAGYLGGRSDEDHIEPLEIHDLGFGVARPWAILPEQRRSAPKKRSATDIAVLARNIRRAAASEGVRPPRKPWLDQLPAVLPASSPLGAADAEAGSGTAGAPGGAGSWLTIGLADEPAKQRQTAYRVNLAEAGNLAVYGGPGSGKTTLLLGAAASAVRREPGTWIYGIDCGGGRLEPLAELPNTGDIIPGDDADRIVRLLGLIKREIADRTSRRSSAPTLLLLIDGVAALRDSYEHLGGGISVMADLAEIAQSGRAAGVHLLIACERTNALPTNLASTVSERLSLVLPSEADYQLLGVAKDIFEGAGPGRAVRIGSENEIQILLPGEGPDQEDTSAAFAALAAEAPPGIARPEPVPVVPELVHRSELPCESPGHAPFAIDTVHLAPVAAPESGLLLVTGPAGSGRTTAIRSLLAAFQDGVTPVDAILLSPRRTALAGLGIWSAIGDTADARAEIIDRLTLALGGKRKEQGLGALPMLPLIGSAPVAPEARVEPDRPAEPFPAPGRRGIVVIEDIGGFDGSGDEQALGELLKLLRRSEVTTIVEGENATLGTVWELVTPLRGARWALALQPDANDAPTVFTVPFTHAKREDFPAGRGFLVRGGKKIGVQVAMS